MFFSKQKSFRKKVINLLVLIALISLLISSGSNLYLVIKNRQSNVMEFQSLAIETAEEKINLLLNEKLEKLHLVVSSPISSLYDLLAKDIYFLLQTSFQAGNFNSLSIIDHEGHIVAKINQSQQTSFNVKYSNSVKDKEFYEESLKTVKSNFNIQDISSVEGDLSKLKDFQETLSTGQYYSPQEIIEGESVMHLSSTIKNSEQKTIGVVTAEISLSEIEKIIANIPLGQTGYLFAINESGQVIACGDRKYSVGDNLSNKKEIKQLLKEKQIGLSIFSTTKNPDNQESAIAGRKIKNLNWYVVSEWPITDAFNVVGNILSQTVLILFATFVFTIILAILFSNQITKPIKTLRRGVKNISQGKFDNKIVLKSNDEFSELALQFNKMIAVLKENKELRDEFVFISAHELRTPVTAVKGYLSMVLDGSFGKISPKIEKTLTIVYNSNERLVQLVNDLLVIARNEAGKMQISITKINIVENVKIVSEELKALAKKKNINLIYKPFKAEIFVQADNDKLKEVLVNIVGNSIKYTLKSSDLNIWHEEKNGFLITHIKDEGIGMTKEEQEKLFSKFYRAQNDDTAQIEGTGLGLFICKEIIERMGGEIWLESEKNSGSTFSFSLKIKK